MTDVAYALGFSDPAAGIWLVDRAEEASQSPQLRCLLMNTQMTKGSIYYNLGVKDEALALFYKALHLADSLGNLSGLAAGWNNIGSIQVEQGQTAAALQSLRKARSVFLKKGSKKHACSVLVNISACYLAEGDLENALSTIDSSLEELAQVNDPSGYGFAYCNKGSILTKKKQYAKAIELFDLAIKYAQEGEDLYGVAEYEINRAESKALAGNIGAGFDDAWAGIALSKEIEAPEIEAKGYDLLATIGRMDGKYDEAFTWLQRSIHINDSIASENQKATMASMSAIHESEQKDQEIRILYQNKVIQDADIVQGKNFIRFLSIGIVMLAFFVLLLFWSNRARRRAIQNLESSNERIQKAQLENQRQNVVLVAQNERLEELNREMDGILHVVAHDLKAPLNQVVGLIAVAEEESKLSPKQEKMLGMAKKVTENASKLVNDLVELGSVEQQASQPLLTSVPVTTLVAEIVATFTAEAARKSIVLETRFPEQEIFCLSESNHLRRVLENLISNALKFSPTGKTVRISLAQYEQVLRIAIEDQGPGISQADQQNLYRKFHKLAARPTGGESSSGLGLAIVKTLVEQLGGEIALTSELGLGSTFVVSMPIG